MGTLVSLPTSYEPWLSKQQIATHYGRTTRWVTARMGEGMPYEKDGPSRQARTRFRLSEVEAWFAERQP